jgi:hypothetical protein
MDVEDAQREQVENGRRNDLTVVGKDTESGFQGGDLSDRLGRPESGRLEQPQPELASARRGRNCGQDLATTDRPIGCADHRDNLDLGRIHERVEDRPPEGPRAEEDRPDRFLGAFAGRRRAAGDWARHARAFEASSVSASSACPTGISSSIDSR